MPAVYYSMRGASDDPVFDGPMYYSYSADGSTRPGGDGWTASSTPPPGMPKPPYVLGQGNFTASTEATGVGDTSTGGEDTSTGEKGEGDTGTGETGEGDTDTGEEETLVTEPPKIIQQVSEDAGIAQDEEGDYIAPTLTAGTEVKYDEQKVKANELFDPYTTLGDIASPVQTASVTGLEIPTPTKTAAVTYQSYAQEGTPEFEAAKGQLSAQSVVGDVQGAVSEESLAVGVTDELDERATVQFQIGKLFQSFEEGTPPPPWAAPAVRNVGAMMAQRGLGASSMAAAAISQALMESGIPIATADANKYATIQLQNLNNKQQAVLQNAATYAAMDKANLDARMTAAVNNARAFLQIDTQNLTGEQQLKTIDLQSRYQKLFNDQAQENAARQFNAKSQLQVDQFFTELETQVANANASRMAAMDQFNTDQTNASNRYYAKLNDAREKFNVQNAAVIQQSNATWRRNINTANTAQANEANRTNALNLLGVTQAAQDKLWQRYRDEASWVVQISENAAQRAHNVAILAQQQDFDADLYDKATTDSFYSTLGTTVLSGVFGILGAKK